MLLGESWWLEARSSGSRIPGLCDTYVYLIMKNAAKETGEYGWRMLI